MQILNNNFLILILLIGNLFVGLLIMYFFAKRKYTSYEGKIDKFEKENEDLNKKLKNVEKNYKELDSSSNTNIEELKNQKQELINYVNKYDAAIKELKKNMIEKNNQIAEMNEQINNYADEVRNLENHMASAAETIKNCTSEIEISKITIKELKEEVTDLEKFNDIQILRAKEAENRVKELWDKSNEKDKVIYRLKSRIGAMQDNFSIISGIGPKISTLLRNAGITTFKQLSALGIEEIQSILEAENPNLLRLTDPTSWPEQAKMASTEEWDALDTYTKEVRTRTQYK